MSDWAAGESSAGGLPHGSRGNNARRGGGRGNRPEVDVDAAAAAGPARLEGVSSSHERIRSSKTDSRSAAGCRRDGRRGAPGTSRAAARAGRSGVCGEAAASAALAARHCSAGRISKAGNRPVPAVPDALPILVGVPSHRGRFGGKDLGRKSSGAGGDRRLLDFEELEPGDARCAGGEGVRGLK